MAAEFRTRYQRPDGTVVELLLDPSLPDDAQTLAELRAAGDPNLEAIDERGRQELAREQYQQNVRESVERLPVPARLFAETASAAQGALSGFTAGFDRVLLRQILDERSQARAEGFREATPVGDTAGYLFGLVAPAIATGGTTLGSRSVATLTQGGLVNQIGNTIGRAAAQRFAPRLGEPAARALGATLGMTADGALGGMLDAVAESNIEDTPLTGERVLAGGLGGAALGALFGGVLGTAESRFLSATTRAQREALQGLEEAGVARRFEPSRLPDYERFAALEPAARRDVLNEIGRRSPVLDEAGRADFDLVYQNADRALAEPAWNRLVAGDIRAQLEGLVDEVERVGAAGVLDAGARQRSLRAAAEMATPEAVEAGRAALRSTLAQIDEALAGTALNDAGRRALGLARGRIAEAIAHSEPVGGYHGEMFTAVDLPRAVGLLDIALDDLPRTIPTDRHAQGLLAGRDLDENGALFGGLRGQLESAGSQWAPAFAATRRARDAYETATARLSRFGARDASGRFRFDAGALAREMGSPDRAARGANRRDLNAWFRAADDALASAGDDAVRNTTLPSAYRAAEDAMQWGDAIGAYRRLQQLEGGAAGVHAAVGNKAMWLLGGMAGIASGNPLLAATGIGLAVASHPASLIRNLQGIRRMLGRGSERAARATQRLRTAMERPRLVSGSAARRAGLGARQVPRVVMALHSPEERQEAYDTAVAAVREFASNPQAALERIGAVTESYGMTHPGTAGGVAYGLVAGIQHLAAHLPPPNPPSPFPVPPRRPSTSEMEDLARRLEAIADPYTVLERTADGSLTAAHVDAVRAAYPRLYQEMLAEVTAIMSGLERPPPYQLRVRTGILFGQPMDPTMSAPFVWASQHTYAQSAAQNEAQLGSGPSATMSTRVAADTQTRAASVTHNL